MKKKNWSKGNTHITPTAKEKNGVWSIFIFMMSFISRLMSIITNQNRNQVAVQPDFQKLDIRTTSRYQVQVTPDFPPKFDPLRSRNKLILWSPGSFETQHKSNTLGFRVLHDSSKIRVSTGATKPMDSAVSKALLDPWTQKKNLVGS